MKKTNIQEEPKPWAPTSTHFQILNSLSPIVKYSLKSIEKQFGLDGMIKFLMEEDRTPKDVATILGEISFHMLDYKLACMWEQPLGYNKSVLLNDKNGWTEK